MIKPRPGLFKWRHVEPEIIVFPVRWYLRFSLSYRDVEELLTERNLPADTHLALGATLRTRTEPEMPAGIETNQRLLEGLQRTFVRVGAGGTCIVPSNPPA